MTEISILLSPEASDRAFVVLVTEGVLARFVHRGADGDVIAVPASEIPRVRRLLDELSR